MSKDERKTFWQDFKQFFVRGLAILLPSVLTLWILFMAYRFVDSNIAEPINAGIRQVIINVAPRTLSPDRLPEWFVVSEDQISQAKHQRTAEARRPISEEVLRPQIRARNFKEYWNDHWYLRLIGLVVAIILIYLAGLLLGGFLGRKVYHRFEEFLNRLPIFKSVYPHVKQVVDFLIGGDKKLAFNRVVLVEYPRKGIWTVGLMTGASMRSIESEAGGDMVTVFIPSSPTPFTGYTINVRKEDAIDIPITIDEALRFVVTGGVLVPTHQHVDRQEDEPPILQQQPGDLSPGPLQGMMRPEPPEDGQDGEKKEP